MVCYCGDSLIDLVSYGFYLVFQKMYFIFLSFYILIIFLEINVVLYIVYSMLSVKIVIYFD